MDQVKFERLKKYCTTQAQLKRLTNVYKLGSERKAAKHEGVGKTAVNQTIQMLEKRAAEMGDSPDADEPGRPPDSRERRI